MSIFDSLCDRSAPGNPVSDDEIWAAVCGTAQASKAAPTGSSVAVVAPSAPTAAPQHPVDALRPFVAMMERAGSRVTCSPPPIGTDEDWLVLPSGNLTAAPFYAHLKTSNWRGGGSIVHDQENETPEAGKFVAFRLGQINLITTHSPIFYDRFLAASSICKRFNLLSKADRIAVFQAVLYGNVWR